MRRRRFIGATAAALALPSLAHGDRYTLLKYVPGGDLPSVDPIQVPSYETRSHGFMVFDTLYGQAGAGQGYAATPQMVAGHNVESDGRKWTLTLRDGLLFHDGSRVLARDCVASIRRWGARDLFGQTLLQRTDELIALDDKTVVFRLRKPFAMLPDALGKFGTQMCPIMPERLAATDPYKPIREVTGSGPFRFKADEQLAGSLHVYERFDHYIPRNQGNADFVSGPKMAHFERIEWHIIPDAASALEALLSGEVDWVEYPMDDALTTVRHDRRIKLQKIGSAGWWGLMRPNHLHPPFDNPAIRRAVMGALTQSDFMTAAIGTDPSLWQVPTGYFPPSTPMASNAGLELLTGARHLDRVRGDIEAAGYSGERVAVILPATLWRARIFGEIAADVLRKVGMTVDEQIMDNATWARQLVNMKPPSEGGWSIFCTSQQGTDALSPASHAALRGNGVKAYTGWPKCPELETLRDQWLDAADFDARRAIVRRLQEQAFVDVPYYPLGTFYPSTAYRSDLTGVLDGQAIFWNVQRQV